MKSQIIVIVIAVLLVANILIAVLPANAAVICVDKYNSARVIPCSDQNAIAEPAGNATGATASFNVTAATNATSTYINPSLECPSGYSHVSLNASAAVLSHPCVKITHCGLCIPPIEIGSSSSPQSGTVPMPTFDPAHPCHGDMTKLH